mgnify:CR=1 FL=1
MPTQSRQPRVSRNGAHKRLFSEFASDQTFKRYGAGACSFYGGSHPASQRRTLMIVKPLG